MNKKDIEKTLSKIGILDSVVKVNLGFKQFIGKITNSQNICPICGVKCTFYSFGDPERKHVMCANCGSLERDRITYFLIKNRFQDIFDKPCKVLHFAPEEIFYKYFKNNKNIDYFPVDFNPKVYESANIHIRKKVNMEDIPYGDNTFDYIYNSHVLEHVPDDIKAMKELYRVLKDDGVCIVVAPIFFISETLEKEEYNTPELRLKYYNQEDHLRKYGADFKNRLLSVGFNVEEINPIDVVSSQDEIELYRLKDVHAIYDDGVFICTK